MRTRTWLCILLLSASGAACSLTMTEALGGSELETTERGGFATDAVRDGRMALARTLPPAIVGLERAPRFGLAREVGTWPMSLDQIPWRMRRRS